MSRYFVDDPPVPIPEWDDDGQVISATPPNVIYIRPKMTVEIDGKVKSELLTLGADGKSIEAHLGANELALLVHNIVRWEGPDLSGVPCDAAHIRTLDPTEPHLRKVLAAIAERNARPNGPRPNSPAASGSASAGGAPSTDDPAPSVSLQLATGTARSPLRSDSAGRPRR